jgi:hypothetical protein
LHEQGCHPEAGKTEIAHFAGRGPAAALFHAAASGAAFSGIDLDAMPVPRIEEISEQRTFTRPMPGQAAVLGQRGRQVLRPHFCDVVGGAVLAGPHAAADTYPLAHPAQIWGCPAL